MRRNINMPTSKIITLSDSWRKTLLTLRTSHPYWNVFSDPRRKAITNSFSGSCYCRPSASSIRSIPAITVCVYWRFLAPFCLAHNSPLKQKKPCFLKGCRAFVNRLTYALQRIHISMCNANGT